jgi:hypothetical protein
MGEFLSIPIRDKVTEEGEGSKVIIFNSAQVCCLWYARLEKENGGCTCSITQYRPI